MKGGIIISAYRTLQPPEDYGTLSEDELREIIEMATRKGYLNSHTHKIWQGKDGFWYTYLPDEDKPKGRRLCRHKTRKALEDSVVAFWKAKDDEENKRNITFADVYRMWRAVQDETVSINTVAKYKSDYKRYFKDTEFESMPIVEMNDDDVKLFMIHTINRYQLQRETMRKCYAYIVNTFEKAGKEKIISESPIKFLKSRDFNRYCFERYVPEDEKYIHPDEMKLLQERFRKDHEEMPWYIPTYAVEFASLTGMRVGEIAALSWNDIADDRIIIHSSEKTDPNKKVFWIDKTKNGETRTFPITDEIRDLLDAVKAAEEKYGYLCEWVFADEKGRIHTPAISSCAKAKCRQLKIPYKGKGIHGYRKTLNSNMRHAGVSAVTAAGLLGHSPAVNEKYYTMDTTNMEEKRIIIEKVNKMTK